MGEVEALDDRVRPVRPSGSARVRQRDDPARSRHRDEEGPGGIKGEEPGVAEVLGEDVDVNVELELVKPKAPAKKSAKS